MEDVYVHEVLQVGAQLPAVRPVALVGEADGLVLPVRPVDAVGVQREAERVRQVRRDERLRDQTCPTCSPGLSNLPTRKQNKDPLNTHMSVLAVKVGVLDFLCTSVDPIQAQFAVVDSESVGPREVGAHDHVPPTPVHPRPLDFRVVAPVRPVHVAGYQWKRCLLMFYFPQ